MPDGSLPPPTTRRRVTASTCHVITNEAPHPQITVEALVRFLAVESQRRRHLENAVGRRGGNELCPTMKTDAPTLERRRIRFAAEAQDTLVDAITDLVIRMKAETVVDVAGQMAVMSCLMQRIEGEGTEDHRPTSDAVGLALGNCAAVLMRECGIPQAQLAGEHFMNIWSTHWPEVELTAADCADDFEVEGASDRSRL